MSSYRSLREAIEELPCIDAHVHAKGFDRCEPVADPARFMFGCLPSLAYRDAGLGKQLAFDFNGRDRVLWDHFVELWPRVCGTGYGRVAAAMFKTFGIDSDALSGSTYEALAERLQDRDPGSAPKVYERLGIRASIAHHLGHPCHNGLAGVTAFLEGKVAFDDTFLPLLGTLPLHDFRDPGALAELDQAVGLEAGSLDELLDSVRGLIARCLAAGVIGLKDHSAYTRGLAFAAPDRAAAETAFARVRSGEELDAADNALSDFILHEIIRFAADQGLPVAMHTGLLFWEGAPPKANASQLAGLLQRHPDVQFDLFHLNFPWVEDMLALMHYCPNCVANCVWAHLLDPAGAELFLARALGSLPADRVIGFGTDGGGLENIVAQLGLAKDAIAGALATAVDRGQISRRAAIEIAGIWLYQAPIEFYQLGREA